MTVRRVLLGCAAAFALVVGGFVPAAQAAPGDDVVITDANLRACINELLMQSPASPITEAQAVGLTGTLSCNSRGIATLTGIEAFTGIVKLQLPGNDISDASPVSGLSQLTQLQLQTNNLTDITPLAALTNLSDLGLGGNSITDLSPLAGLTGLTRLTLFQNEITSIAALSALSNLAHLDMFQNQISDVSPLAGLTSLTWLRLSNNNISDITGIAELVNLDVLDLSTNPLSELAPISELPVLRQLLLAQAEVSDVSQLAGLMSLRELHLSNNMINDVSPLGGLTELTRLFIDRNQITDLTPLVNLTNVTVFVAEGQSAALPAIAVGERQASPIRTPDGIVVIPQSNSAIVDPDDGSWTLIGMGSHTLSWIAGVAIGGHTFPFSGALTQEATATGLTVTGPADVSVTEGSDASFVSSATSAAGTNAVLWQISTDDGASWADIAGATEATLTIRETALSDSGNLYRAVYTNNADGAVVASGGAQLTVTAAAAVPTPGSDDVEPERQSTVPSTAIDELPVTGADAGIAGGTALLLLVVGAVLLALRRRSSSASDS